MRFELHAHPSGGLRVIPTIDDFRLCWLEGHNGIGKTVAVRLLELVTGAQPYESNPAAWASLREHLGVARIEVTGLHGNHRLSFNIDSRNWPTEPTQLYPMATVFLDNEEITLADLRKLLRVFRVGGDESIASQFRGSLQARRAQILQQNSWLDQRIDRTHDLLDGLHRDLSDFSLVRWDEISEQIGGVVAERQAAAAALSTIETKITQATEFQRVHRALQRIQSQGPELESSLREVEADIAEVDKRRLGLQARLLELQPAATTHQYLVNTLRHLYDQRNAQTERAVERRADADRAANRLGVESNHPDLNELLMTTAGQIHQANLDRATVVPSHKLLALIHDVQLPLSKIHHTSLDEEVIAIVGQIMLKVRDLQLGLQLREHELTTQSDSDAMSAIDARLKSLTHRVSDIREAKRLLTSANRAQNDLHGMESQISDLLQELEEDKSEEYKQVTEQLDILDTKRISLLEKQVYLRLSKQTLEAEGSLHHLEDQIALLARGLRIDNSSPLEIEHFISNQLGNLEDQKQSSANKLHQLSAAFDALMRESATIELRLNQVVSMLQGSPDYEWLREEAAIRLPTESQSTRHAIAQLEVLKDLVIDFIEALDDLTNLAGALSEAMGQLVSSMGTHQPSDNAYVRALASYFERQFGDLLSVPEIQSALFVGGAYKSLDLVRGEVSWTDETGSIVRRPIEAFSSGERAFAYVLASILQHASEDARNKVLVLDEFGAFIEAGQLDRLRHFIRERVLLPGVAEQVVIIMPLRSPIQVEGIKPVAILQHEVDLNGYFCQGIPD